MLLKCRSQQQQQQHINRPSRSNRPHEQASRCRQGGGAILSVAEEEPASTRHRTRVEAARQVGAAGVVPSAIPASPPSTPAPATSNRATSAHVTTRPEAAGLEERDRGVEREEVLLEAVMPRLRNAAVLRVLRTGSLVRLAGTRPVFVHYVF